MEQDISTLGRQELLSALQKILNILNTVNQKIAELESLQAEIKQEEAKAKSNDSHIPLIPKIKKVFVVLCIFYGIMLFVSIIAGLLGIITSYALCYLASRYGFPAEHEAMEKDFREKCEAKEAAYRNEHILPLITKLETLMGEFDTYMDSEDVQWANSSLGEQYLSTGCVKTLIQLVDSRRADSLKEALNLYEEILHQQKMESMQQSIVDASQQAAAAATDQAISMRNIARESSSVAESCRSIAQSYKKIARR